MIKTQTRKWDQLLHITLLLASVGLAQLRKTPIFLRSGVDGGVFTYIGARILEGDIPYIDLWDHKPPITYYLNAIAVRLLGPSPWAAWWLGLFWIALCTIVLYLSLRKSFGNWAGFFSALLFAWTLHHPEIYKYGNYTEIYALLPQIMCLAIFAVYLRSRRTSCLFLLGLSTAISVLTRVPALGPGFAAFGLAALIEYSSHHPKRGKIRRLAFIAGAWLLGFILPLAITALYWFSKGGLTELWFAAITFNFTYIGGGLSIRGVYAVLRNLLIDQPLSTVTALAFVTAILLMRRIHIHLKDIKLPGQSLQKSIEKLTQGLDPQSWMMLLGILLLPVEVVLIALSGRNYGHYYIYLRYLRLGSVAPESSHISKICEVKATLRTPALSSPWRS